MANRADEHKMKKKGAQKSGGDARSSRRWGESGNVFFTLFGAVALVGVVGASTATLMRGPLGTVMNLNQKAKADTQMNIAARLAVMETSQLGDGGNCDADSYLEPLSPRTGGGPTGGGLLPSQISASQIDPWGTPYGYCAWDHGNETGCRTGLLAGKATGTDGLAMVIVSAGPDRIFDTVCGADPNYVTKNGDDLVLEYTYSEAVANSDGLWKLMEDDPDTATIGNKNIKVSGSAEIGSGLNVQGGGQFGGGAFHFSDASDFYIPTVTTANQVCTARGSIRVFNGPASETVLQLCNGSVWLDVGGTEAKIAAGADGEVQFAVGSVLSSSPSFAWNNTTKRLEIAGDIQADNLTLGTPGVATVGSLAATDGTLEVTSNLDITGTGNLAVGGNTTVTGTTTLSGVTTVNNTLTVSSGNLTTLNGGVTVDSTATMNGTVLISNGTAGAPGLALISDTDTGLYAVTNGLGLSAGGSERLRVDNDGTTVTGLLTSDNLLVNTAIASSSFEIGTIGSGRGLYGEASDGIKLGTSGGQLVLEAGGDVGIGTNDPQARLDVRGSIASSDYVRIGRSEFPCTGSLAGALRYFDGDLLQVCSNDTGEWETIGTSGGGGGGSGSNWSKSGNHLFYNQTGGNVMIGTGTAVGGLKLLVNGNIGADNFCSADGNKCFAPTEIADGVLTAPGDSGQVMYNNGGTLAGSANFTISATGDIAMNGTGALTLQRGTEAQRPPSPVNGMIRYNTDAAAFEGYSDNEWKGIGGSEIEIVENEDAPDGWALNDLSDVSVSPADGECLKFSYADGEWQSGTCGGAGVAGTDTQVMFNDGDVLAGHAGLTYIKADSRLNVGGGLQLGAVEGLEPIWSGGGGGGGALLFTDLTDTPDEAAWTGAAGKYVRVNATQDALEYSDLILSQQAGDEPLGVSGGGGGGTDTLAGLSCSTGQIVEYDGSNWVCVNGVASKFGTLTDTKWCRTNGTQVICDQDEPTGAASSGAAGYLQFSNGAGGFSNSGATAGQQLVWDNTNKRLGIGKASPASQLDVVGDIQYTGTITDVSDRRLKDDILPLNHNGDSMLRKLGMVDTYSFTMKDDPLKRIEFGVMAQEFEKIFPELVHTANDNMQTKSVNYMGMIAPMIAAMQELQTQNDQLRTELAVVAADREEMRLALHQLGEDVRGLKAHTGYGIGKAQMSLWLVLAAAGGAGLVAFGAGFMRRGRKNAA